MKSKIFLLVIILSLLTWLSGSAEEIGDLFETASLWQVGENKQKVEKAREALASMGEESLSWIDEKILPGKITGLQWRAVNAVFSNNEESEDFILEKFKTVESPKVKKVYISLAGTVKIKKAVPILRRFLKEKDVALSAFAALVKLEYIPKPEEVGELFSQEIGQKESITLFEIVGKTRSTELLAEALKRIKIIEDPLIYWAGVNALKKLIPTEEILDQFSLELCTDAFFQNERSALLDGFFKGLKDSKNTSLRKKAEIYFN